jgi:3-methyl-2-oxobutanoate hydroxymethyltransferase
MVDNFMSAGTNGGEGDEELPSPYGTGPNHRTTDRQDNIDYRPAGPDNGGYGDPGSQPTAGPAGPEQQPRPIWYQPEADHPPVTPGYPVQPTVRTGPPPRPAQPPGQPPTQPPAQPPVQPGSPFEQQRRQTPPAPEPPQLNSWSPDPDSEPLWGTRAPQQPVFVRPTDDDATVEEPVTPQPTEPPPAFNPAGPTEPTGPSDSQARQPQPPLGQAPAGQAPVGHAPLGESLQQPMSQQEPERQQEPESQHPDLEQPESLPESQRPTPQHPEIQQPEAQHPQAQQPDAQQYGGDQPTVDQSLADRTQGPPYGAPTEANDLSAAAAALSSPATADTPAPVDEPTRIDAPAAPEPPATEPTPADQPTASTSDVTPPAEAPTVPSETEAVGRHTPDAIAQYATPPQPTEPPVTQPPATEPTTPGDQSTQPSTAGGESARTVSPAEADQPVRPVAEADRPARGDTAPATDALSQVASAAPSPAAPAAHAAPPPRKPKRVRIHHLREMKERGEKWSMLTAYDQYTAEIFDEAGIQVLLVGDSAANNVYGYESTLRITVDELLNLARGVARSVQHTLVVADLPFGSYQGSPEQAFHTAVRFMKEAGVHAVKLEGGRTVVPQVEKIVQAGIPVMGHIGFTPQSEHGLGGYRVQGRGDTAAALIDDAVALAEAGVFAVVLEMVPGDVAAEITKRIPVPTVGIGAGRDCDAQVLVWQDMAGLRSGPMPRFVKRYADLRSVLSDAAAAYAADVASGTFPADEHTF